MEDTEKLKTGNADKELIGITSISFHLEHVSDVSIEIYDLKGEKCTTASGKNLAAGAQQIAINTADLGITPGNYVYYLQVTDVNGFCYRMPDNDCFVNKKSKNLHSSN